MTEGGRKAMSQFTDVRVFEPYNASETGAYTNLPDGRS